MAGQNIIEFWGVCTRPIASNGLGLSLAQTSRHVSRIEALFHFLPDIPAIYDEWRYVVKAHSVSGMQVHDARLIAAMRVYGVTSVLTFNVEDFRRYTSIAVLHPDTVT